jgi:hypothetical protein
VNGKERGEHYVGARLAPLFVACLRYILVSTNQSAKMRFGEDVRMSVAPVIRRVIVCQRIVADIRVPERPYTISGLVNTIRATEFPHLAEEFWVFVQYSDGYGSHPVSLEVVLTGIEEEKVIKRIALPPIHLTQGRFDVLSRAYKLTAIPFPQPGVYEIRIKCGDNCGTDEIRLELLQ